MTSPRLLAAFASWMSPCAALVLSGCAGGHWHASVLYTEATPSFSPAEQAAPHAAEMTSVVVPPSDNGQPWPNGCPAAGRLFLAYGDFADRSRGTSLAYSSDLACLGAPDCMHDVPRARPDDPGVDRKGTIWLQKSPEPGPDGRCHAGPEIPDSTPHPEFPHGWAATDMGLVRSPLIVLGAQGPQEIKGGRILHFWQTFRAVAPSFPVADVDRWGGGPMPPPSCGTPVKHVGVMVRHSDDCGATWTEPRFIDFADMIDFRGQRPFAMDVPSRSGPLLVRGRGVHWGTDRFEVHVATTAPRSSPAPIYLSGIVVLPDPARDPYGERRVDSVLRSLDGGLTWSVAYAFPDWGGGPKVMTSTPSGRLFVGRCIGVQGKQRFQLFWFDDNGATFKGWSFVDYQQNGAPMECRSVSSSEHAGNAVNNVIEESLSPLGSSRNEDAILAAYGGVEGGRQVGYVVRVQVKRDRACERGPTPGCVQVFTEKKIEGGELRSIRHIDLIEHDYLDYAPANDEVPPVVLGYLEWPSSRNPAAGVLARALVRTKEGWSGPLVLSLRNGQPAPWLPRMQNSNFIGDYSYGTFFATNLSSESPRLHFFWPWPESNPSLPKDNHTLRGNVVELHKE